MREYTIYCTPEQVNRAYKLGAPIRIGVFQYKTEKIAANHCERNCFVIDKRIAHIPTAEQMIGWLREKGIRIEILIMEHEYDYRVEYGFDSTDLHTYEMSYEQTILAAIDASLDYLENKG